MKTALSILLQASVSMTLLYAVYWFLLRKETFFQANRVYLVGALLLSVLLPIFPLKYTILVAQVEPTVFEALAEAFRQVRPIESTAPATSSGFSPAHWLLISWFIGAGIVLLRLLLQTFILLLELSQSQTVVLHNVRIIENKRYNMPFSFFGYIFFNPEMHSGEDLTDIIAHEKVHIRERHWVDLLIVELLTVVFWFNPVVWWYERSIKQNHEYLADKGVLAQGHNVGRYQALLINQLMGVQVVGFTNHLNFSLNATRLKMMAKTKNSKIRAARMAWALPVVVALLLAFAEPVYQFNSGVMPEIVENTINPGNQENAIKVTGKLVKQNGRQPLQGASVILGGTTTGTISDVNGHFQLMVPRGQEYKLYISFVGYETVVETIRKDSETNTINTIDLEIEMKEGVFKIEPEKHFIAPPPPPPPPPTGLQNKSAGDAEKEVFFVVEQLPEYPGGFYGLGQFVNARKAGIKEKTFFEGKDLKGSALLGFTVDANGKVTNIKVLESDNLSVASAAVDLAKGMKDWKPGAQRGIAVPVNFSLPVTF
jgi:TonB family protein